MGETRARATQGALVPLKSRGVLAARSGTAGERAADARARLHANEIEEPGLRAGTRRIGCWRNAGADIARPMFSIALAACERRKDFSRPCGARFADLPRRRAHNGRSTALASILARHSTPKLGSPT